MTTPQEPRTGGVAVARIGDKYLTKPQVADLLRLGGGFSALAEPGTWFPLAEAEALLVVVEKAREFLTGIDEGRIDTLALRNAVEALDA